MKLKAKVILIDPFGVRKARELGTLSYDFDENSTFGNLFEYITSELELEKNKISVWSLRSDVEQEIFNFKSGNITKEGKIDWDYDLKQCRIKDSLETVGFNIESRGFEILCTRTEEIGDGGSGLFIDEIKFLIDNFREILETAILLYNTGKAIKAFKEFLDNGNNVNKERLVRTIRKQERWKIGFCSTKNFDGKEIVEESIMKYFEYTKDEETKEWVDKNMG